MGVPRPPAGRPRPRRRRSAPTGPARQAGSSTRGCSRRGHGALGRSQVQGGCRSGQPLLARGPCIGPGQRRGSGRVHDSRIRRPPVRRATARSRVSSRGPAPRGPRPPPPGRARRGPSRIQVPRRGPGVGPPAEAARRPRRRPRRPRPSTAQQPAQSADRCAAGSVTPGAFARPRRAGREILPARWTTPDDGGRCEAAADPTRPARHGPEGHRGPGPVRRPADRGVAAPEGEGGRSGQDLARLGRARRPTTVDWRRGTEPVRNLVAEDDHLEPHSVGEDLEAGRAPQDATPRRRRATARILGGHVRQRPTLACAYAVTSTVVRRRPSWNHTADRS